MNGTQNRKPKGTFLEYGPDTLLVVLDLIKGVALNIHISLKKSFFTNCVPTPCFKFQDCSRALDASIACDGENFGDLFCANCYSKRFVFEKMSPDYQTDFSP